MVKWELIPLSEKKPTFERYPGIQINWRPQVTAWQVLNGDDVEIGKKKDSSFTCHPTPRRPEDYLDAPYEPLPAQTSLWLCIQTSTQFALSERTFHTYWFQHVAIQFCLWNSSHSLCLQSCASSSQLLLFVLLVSASYPHFDSQSFLSSLAWRVTQHNEIRDK